LKHTWQRAVQTTYLVVRFSPIPSDILAKAVFQPNSKGLLYTLPTAILLDFLILCIDCTFSLQAGNLRGFRFIVTYALTSLHAMYCYRTVTGSVNLLNCHYFKLYVGQFVHFRSLDTGMCE